MFDLYIKAGSPSVCDIENLESLNNETLHLQSHSVFLVKQFRKSKQNSSTKIQELTMNAKDLDNIHWVQLFSLISQILDLTSRVVVRKTGLKNVYY